MLKKTCGVSVAGKSWIQWKRKNKPTVTVAGRRGDWSVMSGKKGNFKVVGSHRTKKAALRRAKRILKS